MTLEVEQNVEAPSKPAINPYDMKAWLETQQKDDGTPYSSDSLGAYMLALLKAPKQLILPDEARRDVFSCQAVDEFDALSNAFKEAPNYPETSHALLRGKLSASLSAYRRYLEHLEMTFGGSSESASDSLPEPEASLPEPEASIGVSGKMAPISLPGPAPLKPSGEAGRKVDNDAYADSNPINCMRRVDFSDTSLCVDSDPVGCVVCGEEITGRGWRDILFGVTEKILRENRPNTGLLYHQPLLPNSARPFFLKDKPKGKARLLSNHHWLYVHYDIPTIVGLIGKICSFCGISLSDVVVEYIPKKYNVAPRPNLAPKTSLASEPNSSESVELQQVPEAVLRVLEEDYKGGFIFSADSIRLLERKSGLSIDSAIQASMRQLMFHRSDDAYFLSSHIISDDCHELMLGIVDEWINTYGCFDLASLYGAVRDGISEAAIRGLDDFENAFVFLNYQSSLALSEQFGAKIAHIQDHDLDGSLRKVSNMLSQSIIDGVADETALAKRFPAFTEPLISNIIGQYIEDVVRTEINGAARYQLIDSLVLPAGFSNSLDKALSWLDGLKLAPAEDSLKTALSYDMGLNFMEDFNISDQWSFRKLISHYHKSPPRREWQKGAFVRQD